MHTAARPFAMETGEDCNNVLIPSPLLHNARTRTAVQNTHHLVLGDLDA